jgi:formamidopyrimidine-DNA glycosylase
MLELPELLVIAEQINLTLNGKVVTNGNLGNSPHKFVWYNRSPQEFAALVQGRTVGETWVEGRWLFIPLEPGYLLVFGEFGGKLLYHPDDEKLPDKYHLMLEFGDGSHLSLKTDMWGAMELYERGKERERQYIKGMRTTPVDEAFTMDYFRGFVAELVKAGKRSVKGLLTQEQLLPGLGNSTAQEIMFRAALSPKRDVSTLSTEDIVRLHDEIVDTVREIADKGGRNDEVDLFGKSGGYQRVMDKDAVGKPCPRCGQIVKKMQYLGGSCYFCSGCQK